MVRAVAILLAAVAVLGVVGCSGDDGGDPDGLTAAPFTLGLAVGDCFDRPASPDVTSVEAVPCRRPHDLEVFALVDLTDGAYPGPAVVAQRAGARCNERFAAYVGGPQDGSGLVVVPYAPDRLAWQQGERTVTCALSLAEGRAEGSARDSEAPTG